MAYFSPFTFQTKSISNLDDLTDSMELLKSSLEAAVLIHVLKRALAQTYPGTEHLRAACKILSRLSMGRLPYVTEAIEDVWE